jgi:hypothetical protein
MGLNGLSQQYSFTFFDISTTWTTISKVTIDLQVQVSNSSNSDNFQISNRGGWKEEKGKRIG